MLVDGLRFFDVTSLEELENMTLYEYEIRMQVAELKQLDNLNNIHMQAMANQSAKATDKSGKPKYRTYKDFFDFDKQQREINARYTGEKKELTEKKKAVIDFAKRFKEYKERQ